MATVRSLRFRGGVWFANINGRRLRLRAKSEEAAAIEAKIRASNADDGAIESEDWDVDEASSVVIESWAEKERKDQATVRAVKRLVRAGRRPLLKIGAESLARIEKHIAGHAPSTRRRLMLGLRSVLRYAKRVGAVARIPRVAVPKIGNYAPAGRPLTDEEVSRFRRELVSQFKVQSRADEWGRFFDLMLLSGLRVGEAWRLRWHSNPNGTAIVFGDDGVPRFETSEIGDKKRIARSWPIMPDAFDAAARGVDRSKLRGSVFRLYGKGNGASELRTLKSVRAIIDAAGVRAGIVTCERKGKCCTSHDLRRTFCKRIVRDKRFNPVQQMALLRHKSLDVTMKHYMGSDLADLTSQLWDRRSE